MTLRLPVALAMCSAMTLAACQAPLPGQTNERTVDGAVIGGLIGGIAGAATGDNELERGLVGAAIGAGIGAAIGNSLDRQAAELRQDLGDDRIRIVNTGSELVVTMPQDILFASDSASLQASLQDDLRALARNLQNYPDSVVQIIGHTDNTASAFYNQDLSERRASAVARVLINAGVSSGRINAFGRGEDQPIASNLTPEGRAQNRRVEIIIRPTG